MSRLPGEEDRSSIPPHRRGTPILASVLRAGAAVVLVGITVNAAASDGRRAVLGTVVAPGTLEIASDPGHWAPTTDGTPILEETALRTGHDAEAMVALGRHGMIGLREDSRAHLGSLGSEGLPLSLQGDGTLSFRLPQATALNILTDAAVVTSAVGGSSPDTHGWIQGTVAHDGSETVVRIVEGALHIRSRLTDETTVLAGGEEATIGGTSAAPRVALLSDASTRATWGRLPAFLGTTTGVVVASAVAVGGALGGAAAAGAFDGSSSAQSDDEQPSASPFRP
jgi:hypothetical protein